MKQIRLIAGLLIVFFVSSCSQQLYKVGSTYRYANSYQEAYYKAGQQDVIARTERSSGAFVRKSLYTQTVYTVDTGWLVAESTTTHVNVTYHNETTAISKSIYGEKKEWKVRVDGKIETFVVEVTRTGTYGRLLRDGAIVGRYTF